VSLPPYSSPDRYSRPGAPGSWEQPGLIPLRPLTVGEIFGSAIVVVRKHLLPLGGAAVLVAALSTIVTIGILVGSGSLQRYAEAEWVNDVLKGGMPPGGILLAAVLGLLVSTIGGPLIAGIATAYAGAQALGRDGRGAVTERLRGRWTELLGVAAIVGVLVCAGLMLLVVPGVIAYLVWVFATPVVVMERASISPALRRSTVLTRGHRGRILGIVALSMIIGSVTSVIVSSLIGTLVGSTSTVTLLIVSQFVAVLVGGLTSAWTGGVVALLYIDVRIRTERLGDALRWAAATDRTQGNTYPQTPGGAINPAGPLES
jgi:hypothetical protein